MPLVSAVMVTLHVVRLQESLAMTVGRSLMQGITVLLICLDQIKQPSPLLPLVVQC